MACFFLSAAAVPRLDAAEEPGPATSSDYSAFKIITERNIFDPNRSSRSRRSEREPSRRPPRVDSFALVGTLSSDKGTFAFFNGSSAEYRKVLKLDEAIAGYKVTQIAPSHVALEANGQAIELAVGLQMRREDEDAWQVAGSAGSFESANAPPAASEKPAEPSASNSSSPSAEDNVLKRLLQKREQELK